MERGSTNCMEGFLGRNLKTGNTGVAVGWIIKIVLTEASSYATGGVLLHVDEKIWNETYRFYVKKTEASRSEVHSDRKGVFGSDSCSEIKETLSSRRIDIYCIQRPSGSSIVNVTAETARKTC